jgi:hypothetical protein
MSGPLSTLAPSLLDTVEDRREVFFDKDDFINFVTAQTKIGFLQVVHKREQQ